jgi:hypothetical protein
VFFDQLFLFWTSFHLKSILGQNIFAPSGLDNDQIACHRASSLLYLVSFAPAIAVVW